MNSETLPRKKYAAQRPARLRRPALAPAEAEFAADQQRRQAILAELIAEAQALVPDPPESPTRKACRESPVGEAVAEKFRRQGFDL